MANYLPTTNQIIYILKKLKHIALEEIHYQLINTCLVISSQHWRYSTCYLYLGCREQPSHINLLGEKCLCIICQIKKTYNMGYLYNLKRIEKVWKLYIALKKDLQEFLRIGPHRNFWFYHYSRKFYSRKSKKDMMLKNYIKQSYEYLCFLDP